jgi:hypothetical protein
VRTDSNTPDVSYVRDVSYVDTFAYGSGTFGYAYGACAAD